MTEKFQKRVTLKLNDMRQNGVNTDVVLVCKEKEFPAHQVVLSAASPYFDTMFQSKFKESVSKKVDFSYVDMKTFSTVLEFMYSSHSVELVERTLDELVEVYKISHMFEIQELCEICWQHMKRKLNTENYTKFLNTQVLNENSANSEYIWTFILKNLKSIVGQENFMALTAPHFKLLLKRLHDKDIPTQDYLFGAIVQWMKKNLDNTKEQFMIVLHLNFKLTSKECIQKFLNSENFLIEDDLVKAFFQLIFPKLKPRSEIEGLITKSPSIQKSKDKRVSVKLFYFGCTFEKGDDYFTCHCENSLKIVDKIDHETHLQKLPLDIRLIDAWCYFYANSMFFFASKSGRLKLSLVMYDWKSNGVVYGVELDMNIIPTMGCCIGNRIYLAGSDCSHSVIVYYDHVKYEYSRKDIEKNYAVRACFSINNLLYLLCIKFNGTIWLDKSHCFCVLMNDMKKPPFFTAMHETDNLCYDLMTVHENRLYAFFTGGFTNVRVFDPLNDEWERFDVSVCKTATDEIIIGCESTKEHGIYLYSNFSNIYVYDSLRKEIEPSSWNSYVGESTDNFFRIPQLKYHKMFMAVEEN